ncbi:hypothetical protein GYB22_05660 [bacterium]|nr:hypothetical protein [bacterium]
MRVYTNCPKCNTEISTSTTKNTRVEFVMKYGETKNIKCKQCNTETEVHVDELEAKPSRFALIVALIVLFIGTPLFFFGINTLYSSSGARTYIIIGGFLIVPFMIYNSIRKQDEARVKMFNSMKYKLEPNELRRIK